MKLIPVRYFLSFLLFISTSHSTIAQIDLVKRFFTPHIVQVTDELRKYIRKDLPDVSHDRNEELNRVDLIFAKGMELSNKDVGDALLSISIAVLNRTDIKPTFPLLGVVELPLPVEDSADARLRMDNLPRYIFRDSPQSRWGDSDKLVHFFGSAYLTYETGTKKLPDVIGNFVEQGEVLLKLDVAVDPRDVFANRLGQLFGEALSDGREVLPSDFLNATFLKK